MHDETSHVHHTHEGHEHTHEHTHQHPHHHASISPMEKPELAALIKVTLEHNEHHLEDLHIMIHQLEDIGESAAAEALTLAMEHYKQGNTKMLDAFKQIKE